MVGGRRTSSWRTTEGEIGILTDHEPVMAALSTGAVIIESGNDRTTVGVHGGFLQVLRNQVTLLTDRAEVATGGRGVLPSSSPS